MDVGEMQRKLSQWAEQRLCEPENGLFALRKDMRLFDLYHLLYDKDWLRLAYERVAANSGSRTAGCDGLNMAAFKEDLEGNLQNLATDLKAQTFQPQPARRVYIPKANGKRRPLGIPTIRDRIVQEALRMILEPVFEAEFYRNSYGFRPNRSAADALGMISASSTPQKKCYWVIEGDIESYFDTINHEILMKLLRRRVRDKKLLRILWRFLKAGVMEGELFARTDKGTPQGGIISPLLANVYLHELDMFMARLADLDDNAKRQRRRYGKPNFVHVRYADDFVVMCNGTRADAKAMRSRIQTFLAEELKLTLSMEKTKITHIDDGFEFLGYQIRRHPVGTGQKLPKLLIPREAEREARRTIRRITAPSSHAHSVDAKLIALNQYLRGWANYYRYAYNASKVFARLDHLAFWQMVHWLGRKHKRRTPKVLREYYRRVDGVRTIATSQRSLFRIVRVKGDAVRARTFHNPYVSEDGLIVREDQFGTEHVWFGTERRPGMEDLRSQVLRRDQWLCQACEREVTSASAHVDHIRPVKRFKRPVDANRLENLQALCVDCHGAKTESE